MFTSPKKSALLLFAILVGISFSSTTSYAASPGDLVKCPDFSSVYYLASDGMRAIFPNERVFFSWFEDFSSVQTISCAELANYPIGKLIPYRSGTRLIKIVSVPHVYAVEPGGFLRRIVSETQAQGIYGADWKNRVDDVADIFWGSYAIGEALTENDYALGTVIRHEMDGTYYLFTQNGWRRLLGIDATKSMRENAVLNIDLPFTLPVLDITETELSPYENPVASPLNPVPPAPVITSPVLTANQNIVLYGDSYRLSWTDVKDAEYLLYRSTNPQFVNPALYLRTSSSTYTHQETDDSIATYYWRVVAKTTLGESVPSNAVAVEVKRFAYLEGVVDTNQPGANTFDVEHFGSFSVPIALASMLDFHTRKTAGADIVSPNDVKRVSDYLAWFLNTNGEGSPERINVDTLGTKSGDIIPGLQDFLDWDGMATNDAEIPTPPLSLPGKKVAVDWKLQMYTSSSGITRIQTDIKKELLANRPVLGIFSFWNPSPLNKTFENITFYDWGKSISHSFDAEPLQGGSVPEEYWNGLPNNHTSGHAVIVVGFLPQYAFTDTEDPIDWLLVQDNWSATPNAMMAIPFNNWTHFFLVEP